MGALISIHLDLVWKGCSGRPIGTIVIHLSGFMGSRSPDGASDYPALAFAKVSRAGARRFASFASVDREQLVAFTMVFHRRSDRTCSSPRVVGDVQTLEPGTEKPAAELRGGLLVQ
ncbi:hypothetical protein NKH70_31555 [Mesorhizobium sp. M0991]|uniref:hypothetical protein n=1 Tax=Mesorhizobium sp. M0991 TaxID=2957043 RepID=UPI00333DAF28